MPTKFPSNGPLTPAELAEARELFAETAEDPKYPEPCAHCGARWIEPDPDGFKDYAELSHRSGCKADKRLQQNNAARTLVPRLLDDVEDLRYLLGQAYAAVKYADMEHDDERWLPS
ncbi:hypothetical protein D3C72_1738640 [compost metagenome]